MNTAAPAKVSLRNVRQATAANLRNERVTRSRVDELEGAISLTAHVTGGLMDFTQMPLIERFRWLLFGTLPSRPKPLESENL